ncbi:hypothetical protein [Flavobacterium urocaniciphilum]|uniref:DUF4345 domain-containing protein n=1 Tax=Flavobacterium urocaniciphilum TaxID=1299341 RepID=A0A1H9B7A0_9FLAO|nr:hypothetical protein [Flavobacterium urocaniciphilum]SEP84892.1 hypothetical protein SAMN05444005_102546 [Flavobacterium urocaniciphilum]
MKPVTRILIGVLGLITLIPLRLGIQSWFGQSSLSEFFGFTSQNSDLNKLFIVTGGYVLMLAVFQILSIIWIINRKPEGFFMAAIVGYTSVLRGIIMLLLLGVDTINNIVISAIPIVIGLLIAVLANLANEKEKLT